MTDGSASSGELFRQLVSLSSFDQPPSTTQPDLQAQQRVQHPTPSLPTTGSVLHQQEQQIPSATSTTPALRSALKSRTTTAPTAADTVQQERRANVQFEVRGKAQIEGATATATRARAHPKTVAFGRTVNVSQTIEAEVPRRGGAQRKSPTAMSSPQNEKMADGVASDLVDLRAQLALLQESASRNDEQIKTTDGKLTMLTEEMHRMTHVLKQVILKVDPSAGELLDSPRATTESDGDSRTKTDANPVNTAIGDESNKENMPATTPSPDVLADWVRKRAATDDDLRRDLGRLVMRYGGDCSLAVIAAKTAGNANKAIGDRSAPRCYSTPPTALTASMIHQTTVMHRVYGERHTTTGVGDSPPRGLAAMSEDSKRFLRQFGHLPADPGEKRMNLDYGTGSAFTPRPGNLDIATTRHCECECRCHCDCNALIDTHQLCAQQQQLQYGREAIPVVQHDRRMQWENRRYLQPVDNHGRRRETHVDESCVRRGAGMRATGAQRDATARARTREQAAPTYHQTGGKSYVDNDRFAPFEDDDLLTRPVDQDADADCDHDDEGERDRGDYVDEGNWRRRAPRDGARGGERAHFRTRHNNQR